jgi:GT2 family glycosyltransferase
MAANCWIVTPTLDEETGQRAVAEASATAGVTCLTHVAVDTGRAGGTRTANRALAATADAPTPFVCYINDDVSFPQQGWLKRLIEALESDERYGIAGPGGYCGIRPQKAARPGMPPGIVEVRQLSYFVVVFRRAVLDELGSFDEGFHHWGCDSDYNMRAREAGWKCVWVRDVWVEHHSTPHAQREPHVQAWKRQDVAYYRRKWRGKR